MIASKFKNLSNFHKVLRASKKLSKTCSFYSRLYNLMLDYKQDEIQELNNVTEFDNCETVEDIDRVFVENDNFGNYYIGIYGDTKLIIK